MIDCMKKFLVRFYVSLMGRNFVCEWIMELLFDDCWIVGKDIQKVEFGWLIGCLYCVLLGDGLWEVWSDLDGNWIVCVIFCLEVGQMILFYGFIKKMQKVLRQEIDFVLKCR